MEVGGFSDEACVERELAAVKVATSKLTAADNKMQGDNGDVTDNDNGDNEIQLTRVKAREAAARLLVDHSKIERGSAPLALLFFSLNIIACYSYLIAILVFYFPNGNRWLRLMTVGLSNGDADWWGNFIGELRVLFAFGNFIFLVAD